MFLNKYKKIGMISDVAKQIRGFLHHTQVMTVIFKHF